MEVVLQPQDGGAHVTVRDDGVGFAPARLDAGSEHYGIGSMRERAEVAGGWWRVRSAPGEGTAVEFWLPGAAGGHLQRPVAAPADESLSS